MKRSLSRFRLANLSSFTLIELLVVIAIIAVLAAVITTAAGTAIRMAQRVKAANMANQLQTAALGYYTEYSVYPTPPTATDYVIGDTAAGTDSGAATATSDANAWGTLICVLSGNIQPSSPGTAFTTAGATITNSHGIAFLTLKSTDVTNNVPVNPLPTGTQIYFNIAMNSSYSGVLGTTAPSNVMPNFSTASGTTLSLTGGTSTVGVAVWANCTGKTSLTNAAWWVHTF
jgi:prepilin-type N-terminal cleavage/methylation domain-containing protein